MAIRLNVTSIQAIIDSSRSTLAKDRVKGNIEDLANKTWEVIGCEIVKPMDGKPYAVVILDGVNDYYFTSTKLTKIVKAVNCLEVNKDSNGVITDSFLIRVGDEEEFDIEENGKTKTIKYFPIEVVDE